MKWSISLWWVTSYKTLLINSWLPWHPLISSSLGFISALCLQLGWRALSSEHPTLKPVQLHRILTQYQLTAEIGPVPTWQPSSEDEPYIYRTGTFVSLCEFFRPETLTTLWQHEALVLWVGIIGTINTGLNLVSWQLEACYCRAKGQLCNGLQGLLSSL